jgi:hypothetical protein
LTEGYAAGAALIKQALVAVRDKDGHFEQDLRRPGFAARVAFDVFDDETADALATRSVELARERGALGVLPLALNYLASLYSFEGDLDAAHALVEESDAIADATGAARLVFPRLTLAGFRGDEATLSTLVEAAEPVAIGRGEGVVLTFIEHARALLYNGLGRYEAALPSAEPSAHSVRAACVRSLRRSSAAAASSLLPDRTAASTSSGSDQIETASSSCALALSAEGSAAS